MTLLVRKWREIVFLVLQRTQISIQHLRWSWHTGLDHSIIDKIKLSVINRSRATIFSRNLGLHFHDPALLAGQLTKQVSASFMRSGALADSALRSSPKILFISSLALCNFIICDRTCRLQLSWATCLLQVFVELLSSSIMYSLKFFCNCVADEIF